MKTRVLFSSIFFMADSVLRGWSRILCWSMPICSLGMDLRGYFGARERRRVLGRWKVAESLTLRTLCELTCRTGRQRCILVNCEPTRLKGVMMDIHHGE